MLYTNNYLKNKEQLLQRFNKVYDKIVELEKFGFDCENTLLKLKRTMESINNDKISIVFVGAFSDGKISIISGWLNEEYDNMKIDSDESSNEIVFYNGNKLDPNCQIVDTPGLFGDKIDIENGKEIFLSDKTKKYVSEANIILFCVDAVNPIKSSHIECLKWILNDLNKIDNIIFVINKLDTITDETNEEEFERNSKIKIDNLKSKLISNGFDAKVINNINVVCISAAPGGKKIGVWKNYRDVYLSRSHIGDLETITNKLLTVHKENLICKTSCDVLNNEINDIIYKVIETEKEMKNTILPELKASLERNKNELQDLRKTILRERDDLKDELNILEKVKVNAIRSSEFETFAQVMDEEIGILKNKEGYRLNDAIDDVFRKYVDNANEQVVIVGTKFQNEYEKCNDFIINLLKKGTNKLVSGLTDVRFVNMDNIRKGIFEIRDLLKNINIKIIFKPHQVKNIAKFAEKACPAIAAGIDIVSQAFEMITTQNRIKKFDEQKKIIITEIEEVFYAVREEISNDNKYLVNYVPNYSQLNNQILKEEKEYFEQMKILNSFNQWEKDVVEGDYRIIE